MARFSCSFLFDTNKKRDKNKSNLHEGVAQNEHSHSLREEAAVQCGGTAVDTSVSPVRQQLD